MTFADLRENGTEPKKSLKSANNVRYEQIEYNFHSGLNLAFY